jgi:pyruvate/2-oxoglutarate dehydrogenase complex dihydrolipoamide dehydrogenase (E3) component
MGDHGEVAVERFDAIVLGAGEAGSLIASRTVAAGHRVALVYKEPYGSTCLNTGCVPSKFLIQRARVAHVVRSAGHYHVRTGPPHVDLRAIVRSKRDLVDEHRTHSFEHARDAEGLTLLEGTARFSGPRDVEVRGRRLTAPRIFVATGLRPAFPAIAGLSPEQAWTSESLMEQEEVPERLLVVGGGYVACELGQAYRRFGADVTIIQSRGHLLPHEDSEISAELERAFVDEGMTLMLDTRVGRIAHHGGGVAIEVIPPHRPPLVVEGSHVLIAAGRRPNTDELNVTAAGIELDDKQHVVVNDRLETSAAGIWAIGDVNGLQPFTRVCQEEAKVAYANAFENAGLSVARASLGHAVFTDPEIGSVGKTEAQARAADLEPVTATVTFDQIPRATLTGETRGFIKYVAARGTRRLLGCHVIGPSAAELTYAAAMTIRRGGTIDEIARTVGIFPTLQEGMEGTARAMLASLAPDEVRGPLVAAPSTGPQKDGATMDKPDKEFVCKACGSEFKTKEELEEHARKDHQKAGSSAGGAQGQNR